MASSSETGHAINVAHFENLISYCTGYGATYNPSKAAIKLAALGTLRTNAQASLVTVTNTNTFFLNGTNTRQVLFAPIKGLATRIVNALSATDATKEMIADAKTINRKIQGARKGGGKTPPVPPVVPVIPPVGEAPPADLNQISVSQQSYDSLIENFEKLVILVQSEPTYTPNETDLQVATLTALVIDLRAKNTVVINATTDLSNARLARNKILYKDLTGLYDIQLEVKKYVKSVYGATSAEYKQVRKIKFTKHKP